MSKRKAALPPKVRNSNANKTRLYYRRISLGMTQQELADELGIHRVTLANAERRGGRAGDSVIERIAGWMNRSFADVHAEYTR